MTKTINISVNELGKVQYLTEVLPQIPTDTILYKKLTGLGATYGEIKAKRNSIIIEPNVPVIIGKCNDPKHRNDNLFGVYEGIYTDDIVKYLEKSGKKYYKILTTPESFQKVKAALALREKCLPEIFKAVECAKVTGEPIARSMEFVFPGQGMERVMDQFMVGDALLVAPVWKQGEVVRSVTLPEGQWRCVGLGETEGDVLNGGRDVVLGENDVLVVLRRE